MAFWCRSFMRVLMLDFGILRLASLVMACSCMAPLTPVVMVMRGVCLEHIYIERHLGHMSQIHMHRRVNRKVWGYIGVELP